MKLALYQPDIPQNTGTMIRMAACLGLHVHIIEPCGFVFSNKSLRRSGMDYVDEDLLTRHDDYAAFRSAARANRIILLSTKAKTPYIDFTYQATDIIMVGRESAGVPKSVHGDVDDSVTIPMVPGMRSLNVAISAAMVVGEALRQIQTQTIKA